MDPSSAPRQTLCLLLDIRRIPGGRLEGRIGAGDTGAWKPFSGTLELLRAIEESIDATDGESAGPRHGKDLP
jgi:hypothetical protein